MPTPLSAPPCIRWVFGEFRVGELVLLYWGAGDTEKEHGLWGWKHLNTQVSMCDENALGDFDTDRVQAPGPVIRLVNQEICKDLR